MNFDHLWRRDGSANALDFQPKWRILKHVLNNQDPGGTDLDSVFQALADPTRRAIVTKLCGGPASVSELAKPFAMSLPAIVQHLQVLEHSGLVRSEKIGRVRSCSIVPATVRVAEAWLGQRKTQAEQRLDQLEAFLDGGPADVQESPQSTRRTS